MKTVYEIGLKLPNGRFVNRSTSFIFSGMECNDTTYNQTHTYEKYTGGKKVWRRKGEKKWH